MREGLEIVENFNTETTEKPKADLTPLFVGVRWNFNENVIG
jgi:hypothetical protein